MRFPQVIAVTWLAIICALAPARAEKRVALVVGNDRYSNLSDREQLQNAVNDAHAIGDALRQIGFEVSQGESLGRQAMLARLDEAAQRLSSGDTVFFFFAGHGVAVDGVNYILPADVPAVGSGQITSLTGASVKEEDIAAALMRTGARVAVVVLDACRNNPFASSGTRGIGGERGLAPHEPPSGVFTLYSAGRSEAALDRLSDDDRNPNSVFSRVLVPMLTRSDLDLPALAVEVRKEVTRLARTVNHTQRPAYYDETSGDRIFLAALPKAAPPGLGAPLPGLTAAPAAPAAPSQIAVVAPPVAPTVPAADLCSGAVTASFVSRCAAPLTAAQERGLKPKDAFRECENCPEMVVVPAGSFTMGSPDYEKDRSNDEGPQHKVTIARPFAVGKFHLTRDQFGAFVRATGHEAKKCFVPENGTFDWGMPGFLQEDGSHPVACVAWDDAKAYVEWVAKKTGKPYRLLSEAEFEYAARGRTSPGRYPRFWFGDAEKDLCRYLNGLDQTGTSKGLLSLGFQPPCDDGYAYTSPAGHFQPNAFGLYDMAGNVSQWTEDCYHKSYDGAPPDGLAWTTACDKDSSVHVVRGGDWYSFPSGLRAAARVSWSGSGISVGFRLARTLTP